MVYIEQATNRFISCDRLRLLTTHRPTVPIDEENRCSAAAAAAAADADCPRNN